MSCQGQARPARARGHVRPMRWSAHGSNAPRRRPSGTARVRAELRDSGWMSSCHGPVDAENEIVQAPKRHPLRRAGIRIPCFELIEIGCCHSRLTLEKLPWRPGFTTLRVLTDPSKEMLEQAPRGGVARQYPREKAARCADQLGFARYRAAHRRQPQACRAQNPYEPQRYENTSGYVQTTVLVELVGIVSGTQSLVHIIKQNRALHVCGDDICEQLAVVTQRERAIREDRAEAAHDDAPFAQRPHPKSALARLALACERQHEALIWHLDRPRLRRIVGERDDFSYIREIGMRPVGHQSCMFRRGQRARISRDGLRGLPFAQALLAAFHC